MIVLVLSLFLNVYSDGLSPVGREELNPEHLIVKHEECKRANPNDFYFGRLGEINKMLFGGGSGASK